MKVFLEFGCNPAHRLRFKHSANYFLSTLKHWPFVIKKLDPGGLNIFLALRDVFCHSEDPNFVIPAEFGNMPADGYFVRSS